MNAVLFSGTRFGCNPKFISDVLEPLDRDTIIIHGAAEGVDSQVNEIAQQLGFLKIIQMPAQWNKYGKSAGPKRNTQMLILLDSLRQVGYSTTVFAFPRKDSKGTNDLIEQAKEKKFHIKGKIING